jgi:hypothetical protein
MRKVSSLASWLGISSSRPRRRIRRCRPVLLLEPLETRELLDAGLGAATPAQFITGLYRDLLGRTPQPSETAGWINLLNVGTTPQQIALAVAGSTEYRDDQLTRMYQTAVGTAPTPAQLTTWNTEMLAGQTDLQLTAALLGSDADYAAHGSIAAGWLAGAYEAVLHRAPDAGGLATWQPLLTSGTARTEVALHLLQSTEAQQLTVTAAYQLLLHRQPDPAGLATWSADLAQGMSPTTQLALLATSPEYLQLQAQPPNDIASTLLSGSSDLSLSNSFGAYVPPLDGSSPQIFLTSSVLSALRTMAGNNTDQWQAFKKRLDNNLNSVISVGYQADELRWITDYALGYQILYPSDSTTADKYADKAIAIMKSGMNDYQKGNWDTRQFLARGDGTTTTFTVPNSDYIPSSVCIYLGPVTTQAVVHGAQNGQDAVAYYQNFLKASNSPDGNPDYKEGTDWAQDGNWGDNMIDWSLGGKQPATGATYYVTMTSGYASNLAGGYTLSGTTLKFKTAPTSGQAVFIEYVYGTHANDYSTLAYQQTSAGDGGFDSIFIDQNYTARYLGKHLATGVDWLWSYPGFNTTLQNQATNLLTQWFKYETTKGYRNGTVESNYGAGGYVSDVFIALALAPRVNGGSAMLTQMVNFRTNTVVPELTNASNSLNGGYYPDGWNYGALAAQNISLAGMALLAAGQISDDKAEAQWTGQALVQLVTGQPTPKTSYDGGDWYNYPSPFPPMALFEVFGGVITDSTLLSYDNYILQNYAGSPTKDYLDLLFRNPSASTSYWSSLPLQNLATGTGILNTRSDWNTNTPTIVSLEMGNLLKADHQDYTPGQLQIARGGDDLLINAWAPGHYQSLQKSTYGNTMVVDDNGDGEQNYRWSMGVWYGSPGVTINAYETTASYVYEYGNYMAAYSKDSNPGGGGSVSYLTRQMVYLEPNYVVVYDRVTTNKASYPKQARWHFLNSPTVTNNGFIVAQGSSKLFGAVFTSGAVTLTADTVNVGGSTLGRLIVQNNAKRGSASADYITALQVAPSSTGSMVSTSMVATTDGRMEGVLMDTQVVLFGKDGNVDLTRPVTYSITANGNINHLLTNLSAGHTYTVTFNGSTLATVTASSQGTANYSTNGSGTIVVQG